MDLNTIIMVHQNVSPAPQNLFNGKQCFSPKVDPSSYMFLEFIKQVLCLLPHARLYFCLTTKEKSGRDFIDRGT